MECANIEHFGILETCEAGNPGTAADLMSAHIEGAERAFLKHLSLPQP